MQSCAVIQFCAQAFADYAKSTAIFDIFGNQVRGAGAGRLAGRCSGAAQRGASSSGGSQRALPGSCRPCTQLGCVRRRCCSMPPPPPDPPPPAALR
jgi:hypothetical protein